MQDKVRFVLVSLVLIIQEVSSARILGVFAHPTRSNSLFVHAIMSTLAAAGHDVTVYSPNKPTPYCGFHHVHVYTEFHKNKFLSMGLTSYEEYIESFSASGFANRMLRRFSHLKTESFLKDPLVQNLLRSNDSFDLIVTSPMIGEQSLLVFGHKFTAPTISLLSMNTWSSVDYLAGSSLSLSFAPEYYAFPFSDKMYFFERIQNVLSGTADMLWDQLYDFPEQNAILNRHASWLTSAPPSVDQMVRDVALTFVNVVPTLSYPKPLPPNVVLIGGIHIDPNSPPLPQDIQKLMDSSPDGVILCSLGSIVPVDTMPLQLIQAFLNAFSKFPQKVIWKIAPGNLQKLPDNVYVSHWLPQQRILDHPNLKLFFTHGGLGSQLEVLRAGVPVVGLPFMTDQPYNVHLFESLGVGVGLRLDTLSEETITTAIKTVLNNNSYTENARRVARIYADRPMTPEALVVYWTEYVLRHGGVHLRPQAAVMSWYQRFLLDVTLVLLLSVTIILYILIKIVQVLRQCIIFYRVNVRTNKFKTR